MDYKSFWELSVIDNKKPIHFYTTNIKALMSYDDFMRGWNEFERTVTYPYQGCNFEIDEGGVIIWKTTKQLDPGMVV